MDRHPKSSATHAAQRTRIVPDSIPPTTGTNRNRFRGDKSVREAHMNLSRKRERDALALDRVAARLRLPPAQLAIDRVAADPQPFRRDRDVAAGLVEGA